MNLLSLRTSAVSYDFVQADSAGDYLQGFTTTRLRNEISSDFLRGLTVSVEHDLFQDTTLTVESTLVRERDFAPHLSALNLGFSVNASSAIVRWLGLGGADPTSAAPPEPDTLPAMDPFGTPRAATDEASIIPGRATDTQVREARAARALRRDWNATVSYALNRPRGDLSTSQLVQLGLNTNPTQHWQMSWQTSYDLEGRKFNDHAVRLTRDIHDWQANFDFLKTATGNWAFRFEVSLLANPDLKFDYEQHNLAGTRPGTR